jgi:orotate phosphoribosyltransferase-like protein
VSHAEYLRFFYNPARRKKRVKTVSEFLENKLTELGVSKKEVTVVGTGISGLAASLLVSDKLDMNLATVRKPTDSNHSYREIEATKKVGKYFIVDDFISTGDTVKMVVNNMKKKWSDSECLGFIGFNDGRKTMDEKEDLGYVQEVCPRVFYPPQPKPKRKGVKVLQKV